MRKKPNFLFLVVITYLSTLLFASNGGMNQTVQVPVTVAYDLSSTDSRVSALQEARAMARREAASHAGTYIEGESKLENGTLSESIREVQTSVVRLTEEKTSFDIPKGSDTPRLTLSAIAEVDTSTLEKRIRALQENHELSTKVQALARENAKLRQSLKRLDDKMAAGVERLDLEKKRLMIKRQLSENSDRLVSAFDGGSLLDFRKKANVQLELKNQEFERDVLYGLLSIPDKATIDSATGDDRFTVARIKVQSDPVPSKIWNLLYGTFRNPQLIGRDTHSAVRKNISLRRPVIEETAHRAENNNPTALDQLDFTNQHLVAIEVALGKHKKYVPLLGVYSDSFNVFGCRDDVIYDLSGIPQSHWGYRKDARSKMLCLFGREEALNHVVEFKVPNSEAKDIRSVSVRRVIVDTKTGKIL